MLTLKKMYLVLAALMFSLLASAPAMAAAIDVDDVVTDIGAQLVPIGLIGLAVLGVVVAIKAFKWVRSAAA